MFLYYFNKKLQCTKVVSFPHGMTTIYFGNGMAQAVDNNSYYAHLDGVKFHSYFKPSEKLQKLFDEFGAIY